MPQHPRRHSTQRGFTLIELVITIVVLAAGLAGILVVFTETTTRSVDPQIRAQARALAQGYMEEILLQPYADPNTGAIQATEEANRADYDDVWDYDAITNQSPPEDRLGNPINQLGDYSVSVSVTLNAGAADVAVTVQHTASSRVDYTLRSARANY